MHVLLPDKIKIFWFKVVFLGVQSGRDYALVHIYSSKRLYYCANFYICKKGHVLKQNDNLCSF